MINSIGCIPVEAAKLYGDKTALILPDRELSFNELEALSNRCANALVKLGVKPGDRVTLYSSNCWEWVVSYYGALKTGAVINPINVMLTPGEVEFVANDCGAISSLATTSSIEIRDSVFDTNSFGLIEMMARMNRGEPMGGQALGAA